MVFILNTCYSPDDACDVYAYQLAASLIGHGQQVALIHPGKVHKNKKQVALQKKGLLFFHLGEQHYSPFFLFRQKLKGYLNWHVLDTEYDRHEIYRHNQRLWTLAHLLKAHRPARVLIAQGCSLTGLDYAYICRQLQISYSLFCHQVNEQKMVLPQERFFMQQAIDGAQQIYFASTSVQHAAASQLDYSATEPAVFFTPLQSPSRSLPMPETNGELHLLCMGRMDIFDNRPDLLIHLMALEKWRNRPLYLSFLGEGPNWEGLKELCAFYRLDKVTFLPPSYGLLKALEGHHALVLAAREGAYPMEAIEAISKCRMVIATDVGLIREWVSDGITGFLGESSLESLDATWERAWSQSELWPTMAQKGYEHFRHKYKDSAFQQAMEAL
ncbi:glycosyltransferase [Olivibacter sitiensis]|uniref:glycosyltransferase n=1 Tax=Olivibacter sitiensis TaxID=376470 RepID=UPI00048135AF|nr:glycosyltransferase [Olivibacter sitiensis]